MAKSEDLEVTPRFQLGAIFSGAALSLAVSIVLLQFGAAIGLTADAPLRGEANIAAWGMIAAGLWLLWVQLLASLAGGYLAGRLRVVSAASDPHDNEMRDGMAGLLTWAIASVLAFIAIAIAAAFSTYVAIATDSYNANATVSDAEQNKALIFAFVAGSTSLLSAAAAWWAGTMGGDHRDQGTDFSKELSFRR